MNADLQGVLNNLNRAYVAFEFDNGRRMTKSQVKRLCEYGLKKGYETTNEMTPEDEKRALANER
jgi:hypothetical protein